MEAPAIIMRVVHRLEVSLLRMKVRVAAICSDLSRAVSACTVTPLQTHKRQGLSEDSPVEMAC